MHERIVRDVGQLVQRASQPVHILRSQLAALQPGIVLHAIEVVVHQFGDRIGVDDILDVLALGLERRQKHRHLARVEVVRTDLRRAKIEELAEDVASNHHVVMLDRGLHLRRGALHVPDVFDLPAWRQGHAHLLVGAHIRHDRLRVGDIGVGKILGEIEHRDRHRVALDVNRFDFVVVVLVIPVFIGGAEDRDALVVVALLPVHEQKQLVGGDVHELVGVILERPLLHPDQLVVLADPPAPDRARQQRRPPRPFDPSVLDAPDDLERHKAEAQHHQDVTEDVVPLLRQHAAATRLVAHIVKERGLDECRNLLVMRIVGGGLNAPGSAANGQLQQLRHGENLRVVADHLLVERDGVLPIEVLVVLFVGDDAAEDRRARRAKRFQQRLIGRHLVHLWIGLAAIERFLTAGGLPRATLALRGGRGALREHHRISGRAPLPARARWPSVLLSARSSLSAPLPAHALTSPPPYLPDTRVIPALVYSHYPTCSPDAPSQRAVARISSAMRWSYARRSSSTITGTRPFPPARSISTSLARMRHVSTRRSAGADPSYGCRISRSTSVSVRMPSPLVSIRSQPLPGRRYTSFATRRSLRRTSGCARGLSCLVRLLVRLLVRSRSSYGRRTSYGCAGRPRAHAGCAAHRRVRAPSVPCAPRWRCAAAHWPVTAPPCQRPESAGRPTGGTSG